MTNNDKAPSAAPLPAPSRYAAETNAMRFEMPRRADRSRNFGRTSPRTSGKRRATR